jgi:ATP-binding cassette subfamily B protein
MIVIAHRFSAIEDSDNIYMLKEGQVIESGTHQELITLGGVYKEMSKK